MNTRKKQIRQTVYEGIHDAWFRENDPNASALTNTIDTIQNYADIFGLVPVAGDVVDLTSAGVDALQGQWGDAAMRGVSAVPIAGDIIGKGAKVGTKIHKLTKGKLEPLGALAKPIKKSQIPVTIGAVAGRSMMDDEETAAQPGAEQPGAEQSTDASKPKDSPDDQMKKLMANQMLATMYNTRQVSTAPLSTFADSLEITTNGIAELLNEEWRSRAADAMSAIWKRITGRGAREAGEEAGEKAARKGMGKWGTRALVGGAFALPFAIGKLTGGADDYRGGQGLVPGGGAGGQGIGSSPTVIDRLTSLSGYMPFNPAQGALAALGKRVGRA